MKRHLAFLHLFFFGVSSVAIAGGQEPVREAIPNWPAPAFWNPPVGTAAEGRPADGIRALQIQTDPTSPLPFIAVNPCRVYDSRNSTPLLDNTSRAVTLTGPSCAISSLAQAVSVNITVFNIAGAPSNGVFRVGIVSPPPTAWINFPPTETQRANAGVVTLNGSGQIIVQVNMGGGQVDFVVDVNGYYAPAGTGDFNTFLGLFAGNSTMTGESRNTAIGYQAFFGNTTGARNTAIGVGSLTSNTTGMNNTGSGYQALFSNTMGNQNTGIGRNALFANITGSHNTAVGSQALFSSDSDFNTAIGDGALMNATGSANIGVGSSAGFNLTTGFFNICIGSDGVAGESGTIRIGDKLVNTATYIAGISGALTSGGIGVLVDTDGKLGTDSSSRRFKEEIRDIAEKSDGLMRLRPVAFKYKAELDPTGLPQYGLIAEEVAEVYPELVVYGRDGQPETVRYHLLVPMLLNEVQRDRKTITDLKSRLERLEALMSESGRQK